MKAKGLLKSVLLYLTVNILAFVMLLPLFWMISTSLKPNEQVYLIPPKWIPNPIMWSNYPRAFSFAPFGLFIKNSVIITVICVVGVVFSSSLAGYSFAKLRWPGRDIIFFILLGTMMLPGQVTMIPIFILFKKLGWINTFYPLTVPSFFGGGAFNIFLMRQFFLTIPYELDEAARIDGASFFKIYTNIELPLSIPVVTAISIFTFIGSWNEFMGPLIYLNDSSKYTIQLGLRMFQADFSADWSALMAMSIVAALPCIVLFFIAQRYFIQGIVLTGLKE
ncbi:MAG: carbohydrate ABC transporter permease [Dictyoglomi bacterium]|nr:carbohydrate ABC transporter permease [Dictyoglomota bacterium]HHV81350.1 carbohydrate ABC transporter permease [bacterium]HOK29615.1 carbohydrate ABC transporter permease [bacterium]HOL55460.1 carbohydrate ABC transporter permease [bacterium]HPO82357.1 carbohydrate ABC transporter permease [bacterium]